MHSEKEGWREIKGKRIAAKSVRAPTRLVKPTRPSQSSSRFIPQTIFSFFLCDFHQKPFLSSENVSFVHMRGWSRNWNSSWSPVALLGGADFPPSLPSPCCQFFDIWRLGQGNKLLSTITLFLKPKEKIPRFWRRTYFRCKIKHSTWRQI